MALRQANSHLEVCTDELHALVERLWRGGEEVIELWTTIHGELVLVVRRVPELLNPRLDGIQAKIEAHSKGK